MQDQRGTVIYLDWSLFGVDGWSRSASTDFFSGV